MLQHFISTDVVLLEVDELDNLNRNLLILFPAIPKTKIGLLVIII